MIHAHMIRRSRAISLPSRSHGICHHIGGWISFDRPVAVIAPGNLWLIDPVKRYRVHFGSVVNLEDLDDVAEAFDLFDDGRGHSRPVGYRAA